MNGMSRFPIGTIVSLKDGIKKIMITGYFPVMVDNDRTIFDYSGCMYPEGFMSSDKILMFNHNQIEKVYHMGLCDQECIEFHKQINILISNGGYGIKK